jgi:hypothetical protein
MPCKCRLWVLKLSNNFTKMILILAMLGRNVLIVLTTISYCTTISFQKQPFMYSPMFIKRSHYQRSPWRRSCWSFWQRQNFSSCTREFHLAQNGTRCCATHEAMSNLPLRKESQIEHQTIYLIAYSKCSMGGY